LTVSESVDDGDVVQTRTAFRFTDMMSPMCGRRLFGACNRNASSSDDVELDWASAANATVRTFFSGEVARRPPSSANAATKPTCPGSVVTKVNPCDRKHVALAFGENGVELRTPQPATRAATARNGTARRITVGDSSPAM
jgi:hypothetical protein